MKKNFLLSAFFILEIFISPKAWACINSNCKPCPIGFSVTQKCCKETDNEDCVILKKEIEDCGVGQWKEYSYSVSVKHKDFCCTDATESRCRSSGNQIRYCGIGDEKEFPYSPVKKCCKDTDEKDCVIIRAKRDCGKYQLNDYPVRASDCCNLLLKKCTGSVTDCPRCI